jgi:hypothetical protein
MPLVLLKCRNAILPIESGFIFLAVTNYGAIMAAMRAFLCVTLMKWAD